MQSSPVTAEGGSSPPNDLQLPSPREGVRHVRQCRHHRLPIPPLPATWSWGADRPPTHTAPEATLGRELPSSPLPGSGPGRRSPPSPALSPGAIAWCAGLF